MDKNEFIKLMALENVNISDEVYEKLEKYYEKLVLENSVTNLTAITDKKDVFYKHFYDSIVLSKFYDFNDKSICDVGSGAGFPSIPLKIVYPSLSVSIVDSLGKRIKFLEGLAKELDLDVSLVNARAEEYAVYSRESFDIVTARAVANLPVLCELCIPLLKVGGMFLVPKGSNGEEELELAKGALKKLLCSTRSIVHYDLPFDYGSRTCILIDKNGETPKVYPRNFGQIKKSPL